jgi:hypothetical protein
MGGQIVPGRQPQKQVRPAFAPAKRSPYRSEGFQNANFRKHGAARPAWPWPRDQQTPKALAACQKAEIDKWWPLVKAANMKVE